MHRRDGKLIVSATDLVGFLACGHLTRLERAAAQGLVEKPMRGDDPMVELLRWRGGEHEKRYIADLERQGRRITNLQGNRGMSYAEQAAATEAAMRDGADVIYQGTVFDGRWLGYPDFLLRLPPAPAASGPVMQPVGQTERNGSGGTQQLGLFDREPAGTLGRDWHYEVADTKLAHSAKASALLQICSYVDQVARIQRAVPERVYVVTGGAEAVPRTFRTDEMMAYYRHARRHFEDALDEAIAGPAAYPVDVDVSYPDPVEHCAVCKWFYQYCRQQWRDDDALPQVAAINRRQRALLKSNSVTTMTSLSTLEKPIRFESMKSSQSVAMWNIREQARLQVASKSQVVPAWELLELETDSAGVLVSDRGLSALPEPSGFDLFFDIEGDPFAFWEGLEYLFGIWDGANYGGYWALTREQEKQQFERVIDLFHANWTQHREMHIYHYGAYEPSRLKHLAGRHATRQEQLDELLRGRVFVDLLRVVRQGVRVGSERYSIKNLEPLYGFTREIELRDANSSIVEFEKLLEVGDPGDELKSQIQGYNADDCRSTHLLRDWLELRRVDAAKTFSAVLPRPPHAELQTVSEDLSDRIRAVRELTDRLTANINPDPDHQSVTDKATWLVAHLLDWHRREDKSTWWRYYDLLSKTGDELFEEADSMGHLEFDRILEGGGTRQSDDYRYRFPPQEHKIELGGVDDPEIEGDNKRTGNVVAIDEEAGTVDIRRLKKWNGPHPASLVQIRWIPPTAQRDALMRFGEWVAQNGIASDADGWRAARDLLLRAAPRLRGGHRRPLATAGQPGSEAARDLAPQLDGTTLAIQGPPGSGKTYTGARMILDLVHAGRRVGITSNSHKVIANLVRAVVEAGGGSVAIVQKCDEEDVVDDSSVKRVGKNQEVADALHAGEAMVAAGTPWLWADEDLIDSVDTLFVDEAGQVSLANVVAVSGSARNLVLLGDPQQLDQPTQGVHPDGSGVSALTHLLKGAETVPPDLGIFLERTHRMHPQITSYTSRLFYEGKLEAIPGLDNQEVLVGPWAGSGLRWRAVEHDGNTNESPEEAHVVVGIVRDLVGRAWRDNNRAEHVIGPKDVLVTTPFNAHRLRVSKLLREAGLADVPVGTVDKFQGQQAVVSIYTMATSRPDDAPRGMSFLFNLHRLNVATSRAQALAIVVANPCLLDVVPETPDQLRMANALAAFVESANAVSEHTLVGVADGS